MSGKAAYFNQFKQNRMKKLTKVSVIVIALAMLMFSCNKEDMSINKDFEKINQQVELDGKIYNLEYLYNAKTGEWQDTEKNNEFNALTDQYEESVLAVFDDKQFFFKTREDYFTAVVGEAKPKSSCTGTSNTTTIFYRDVNYQNFNDIKYPNTYTTFDAYRQDANMITGWFGWTEATTYIPNVITDQWYGYKMPSLEGWRNDDLSSLRVVNRSNPNNDPNSTASGIRTDFTVVMFRDGN